MLKADNVILKTSDSAIKNEYDSSKFTSKFLIADVTKEISLSVSQLENYVEISSHSHPFSKLDSIVNIRSIYSEF